MTQRDEEPASTNVDEYQEFLAAVGDVVSVPVFQWDRIWVVLGAAQACAKHLRAMGCTPDNAWFTDEAKALLAAVNAWEAP